MKLKLSKPQILLLCAVLYNCLIYYSGRTIGSNLKHFCLSTALDDKIPFIPWTVLIYWGCYLFWIYNYYISVKYDKGNGCRFIGTHYIGETICFFFFVLFPTTMARPEALGETFLEQFVHMTYACDAADNLFPSIHCFASWLCWIGVRRNKQIPRWYQLTSLLIAIAVCISTLTVKQHVLADVPAGILLAELSYALSGALERKIYKRSWLGETT